MNSDTLETECFGGSYKVARQDKSESEMCIFVDKTPQSLRFIHIARRLHADLSFISLDHPFVSILRYDQGKKACNFSLMYFLQKTPAVI